MLLAFLSDIHGNLPALKAALEDASERGAQRAYCAGDITGYGPFPSEVCHLLEERQITAITGNYDVKVLAAYEHAATFKKNMKPGKWKILNWTCAHLDGRARSFLSRLPEVHQERLPGEFDLLMVHGSPRGAEDPLYQSVTVRGLRKKLAGASPDILVCGHTHLPFVKRLAGVSIVNCGSAGHPVDGDPRPAYALIRIREGMPPAGRIIRFDYPQEEVIQAIERSALPQGLANDFREGNKKREMP